jgi:cytoplasmic iron level regulating protein YaaA (DUF328/UPF0246 family)
VIYHLPKIRINCEKLSALNFERFQTFKTPLTLANAKQALFAFKGEVK